MTNSLYRSGGSYTIPEVPPVPAQPAYSYFVEETIQLPNPSYSNPPAGWGYRVATSNSGSNATPTEQLQLVYLGPDSGAITTVPSNQFTTTTRTVRVDVPAVPGRAGSPAVKIYRPPLGWTSFAHSKASIPGAGRAEWKVGRDVSGVVVGFTTVANPTVGYGHITHGLVFTDGLVKNARTGALLTSFTSDDAFTMRVSSTDITYLKNDDEIGTEASTYAPTPLMLGAALYAPGDLVTSPALFAHGSGGSDIVLPQLRTTAADTNYASSEAVLPALTISARTASRSAVVLPALLAFGAERLFGQSAAELPELEILAYGGTVPIVPKQGSDTVLPGLLTAGLMLVGETGGAEISLEPLWGAGSDRPYGYSAATLPKLTVTAFMHPTDEAFMVETLHTAHPLTGVTELVAVMMDGVLAGATFTAAEILDAAMQELITATPSWATSALMDAVMYSLVHSGAAFAIPSVGAETWAYNVDSGGSSSYSNFEFNSYAKIGDKYYGANPSGLFELDGDTDAGAPIRAVIGLGQRDFGTATKKTVSECYIGMSAKGNLFVKVIAEGAEYIYKTRDFSDELQQQRVKFGKGLRTNYVWLDIYNEDGADFEIDTVEFHIADLTRRI